MENENEQPFTWKTSIRLFYGFVISAAFYTCYLSSPSLSSQYLDVSSVEQVRLVTDLYFRWENGSQNGSRTPDSDFDIDTRLSIIGQTKRILIMEPLWGYRFVKGRSGFINAGCPINNCLITFNRSLVPNYNFDAFIMHLPTAKKPWMFPNRRPDQMFVFFSTQPPPHMPNLKLYEGYFNRTMTYLKDSDFPIPYGRIEPLDSAPQNDTHRLIMMQDIRNLNVNPAAGKNKLVVWMVSNCHSNSNRHRYVKNLQKYIRVDVISSSGTCQGQDLCPKSLNEEACYDMIESTYKFYLAFENAICGEYVTDKFFNIASRNIVPVVLGGANYSSIAPKHSYINAMDYSPKELAKYLTDLDKQDNLYAEYFWWKPHYRVLNLHQTNRQAFCQLCAALHNKTVPPKTVTGLHRWYFRDKCVYNLTFRQD